MCCDWMRITWSCEDDVLSCEWHELFRFGLHSDSAFFRWFLGHCGCITQLRGCCDYTKSWIYHSDCLHANPIPTANTAHIHFSSFPSTFTALSFVLSGHLHPILLPTRAVTSGLAFFFLSPSSPSLAYTQRCKTHLLLL